MPFPTPVFGAVAPGFHIPAANKQTTIWTVLVTTIMPASPNDQTPRPTSAFIAISRCPVGSEGKPIQDQRKENGNAEAHPLARGEHSDRTTQDDLQQGSSPLTQGTRQLTLSHGNALGIIPAHAGNMRRRSCGGSPGSAHPSSRGEHPSSKLKAWQNAGSSPLARGTLYGAGGDIRGGGLIPARAGNTANSPTRGRAARAHPRSRGEHRRCSFADLRAPGSSPLARGTRNP